MKQRESTRLTPAKLQRLLDSTLASMIDEWYNNVCGYYSTELSDASNNAEPELKRFHDEKGHRIKFSKETLQCTYGLRIIKEAAESRIEVSVNNKFEAFDYDEFLTRLEHHYRHENNLNQKAARHSSQPSSMEIFLLESDFRQAFSVERSAGKADVVRLSFRVDPNKIERLAADPEKLKARIEEHCLSPLRRIYAELYRRSMRA